jgi:hypothetical protein
MAFSLAPCGRGIKGEGFFYRIHAQPHCDAMDRKALMRAPTYQWICHRCEKSSPPNTDKCVHCGFAAVASAEEIDPERFKQSAATASSSNFWLLFLEGPIAIFFWLASPWEFVRLLLNDRPLAALLLLINTVSCSYGLFWSWRHKQKPVAYLAMICLIAGGMIVWK